MRAWRGAEPLATGSPQQRALLAALLLREGRTATPEELIDALWGEAPPARALAALRTYASRLRKVLGPGVLVSESGGYALRPPAPDGRDGQPGAAAHGLRLDLVEARLLAERARTQPPSAARESLDRALALWDGEVLAGVPGPYAAAQRARLEEWRLQLLELRLEKDLELGRHAEAVSELTALTAEHPLRERLRELLMLALYRSGRQAEALAVYADTRRLLADELGVDPGPALSDLQQRVLRADPALAGPAGPSPAEPAPPVRRPAQLPASVRDFTGRDAFVAELGEVLASGGGRVMAVSAVAGTGGIGKTTLAVHVAHRARSAFPDGQLYVDLRGAGPRPAAPHAVLGAFLRALGVPESSVPESPDERAALYRSVLDGRRVLVLLDNARDAAQVRPLLPGAEGCAALVTSRTRMVDLAGAHLVDLDVMTPGEALDLFTRIVGEERVAGERRAALDVVAACGHLPLAIRVAASRLAARRGWTVASLAARLADERRRLDELQAGDLAVKATFELGYGQLDPAQARAFRLLGLPDGPDLSLPAAAALLGLDADDAEELLESLVDISLLESAAPGRYRFHDLVRLHARACAERDEEPDAREAALSRLLDFHLATAARAYSLERPGDRLAGHLAPTAHPGLPLTSREQGRDWLYAEAHCLLACVRRSARPGTLRRAADLLWAAVDLAESGANAAEYEAVAALLRDTARAAGDPRAEARAGVALAFVHQHSGSRFDDAAQEAERALALSRAADDPLTGCWASNIGGVVALYQNRHDEGAASFSRAIDGFRALGDRPGEASALCNLSRVHLAAGRVDEAVALARRGTAMYDEMGHGLKGANGRYALGLALTRAGRFTEAAECLRQALWVFRQSRQRLWEGMTLFRIAELDLAARRPAQAAAHAERALALLDGVGGDWRHANVLTVLGRALAALGQRGRAEACWSTALALHERLGSAEAEEVRALLAARVAA